MTVSILQGDCIARLRELPADSVHCVVTSPPYWGLRDYGTGTWEGGELGCDHRQGRPGFHAGERGPEPAGGRNRDGASGFSNICRCGARRIDQQIGLEPTPEAWATKLVEVFREVRRVLRPDGVCFVNCGSSYVSGGTRSIQSRQLERAPACGSDGKELEGSTGLGSACSDRDGEHQDGSLSHRGHTQNNDRQPQLGASQPEQTGCGSEPADCAVNGSGGSHRGSPATATSLASSPSALDASGLEGEASACLFGEQTGSPAIQASAHRAAECGTSGTAPTALPSGCRTGNGLSSSAWIDPSCSGCGVCWSYLAIPRLQLKAKDLLMQAHLLALALQADGWWIRQEIIWGKPNPLPESVTDRPTKAHEQVFLLTKNGDEPTFWLHRDHEGTRTRPAPDYRWVHRETGEEVEVEPDQVFVWVHEDTGEERFDDPGDDEAWKCERLWKRINLWRGAAYFWDAEAVREAYLGTPRACGGQAEKAVGPQSRNGHSQWERERRSEQTANGRNLRSVWTIATEAFPEAHFATYPTELVRRCILAGTSAKGCCPACGAPWVRVVQSNGALAVDRARNVGGRTDGFTRPGGGQKEWGQYVPPSTLGWRPSCSCAAGEPVPCTALDPFGGSGTTGLVADQLGRDAILLELSLEYAAMAERRIANARARRMLGDVEREKPLPGQLGLFT